MGPVRKAAVVIALVLAPGATGCGLLDVRPDAGIVGDSITLQVVDEVRAVAGDDWRLDIRPLPGATVGDMLPEIEEFVKGRPEQVIVNLGRACTW
jgi:hypothetical protein